MDLANVVVSVVTAVFLFASGTAKQVGAAPVVESLTKVGVPRSWFRWLGLLLYAGAVGLLVGLLWAPIGIAAGVGLVLYFLGAIGFHVKAGDTAGLVGPLLPLALSIASLVLQILAA